MKADWKEVALATADILLPRTGTDMGAWAVVACDQYTSQPEYWQEAERLAGDKPSALRITLPEIYLDQSAGRVPMVHQAMADYLQGGILTEAVRNGFVLTERTTQSGARLGLVCAVDLDSYDFSENSRSMIRATEGTILSRIPPRLAVRSGAAVECPHVLLLLDDVQRTVVEPLYDCRERLEKFYDFPLMLGGGHVRGWAVTELKLLEGVYAALMRLKRALPQDNPLLMAVGDGNHSLATARAHWLSVRERLSKEEAERHPARYALAEVENIHDPALRFHPIHRVLFHAQGDALLEDWASYCREKGMDLGFGRASPGEQSVTVVYQGKETEAVIRSPEGSLAVGTLQRFLDDYLNRHKEAEIDYIHGEEAVRGLCGQGDAVGFLVPGLDKSALLPAVRRDGALPRKTFSMGEAHEKRYYLECRRIV